MKGFRAYVTTTTNNYEQKLAHLGEGKWFQFCSENGSTNGGYLFGILISKSGHGEYCKALVFDLSYEIPDTRLCDMLLDNNIIAIEPRKICINFHQISV